MQVKQTAERDLTDHNSVTVSSLLDYLLFYIASNSRSGDCFSNLLSILQVLTRFTISPKAVIANCSLICGEQEMFIHTLHTGQTKVLH